MYPDGRVIHIGINFLSAPMKPVDKVSGVRFQNELIAAGLDDYDRVTQGDDGGIVIVRDKPLPLEVRVAASSAPPPLGLIGQLLILSAWPGYDIRSFGEDAQAVVQAFENAWPVENRELISSDATVRVLFQSTAAHSFKEIWEDFLGKAADDLSALRRPVLGGGIRFVMPPVGEDPEGVQIETKIESWFKDSSKIFVEAQFKWNPPLQDFDSLSRVEQVYSYIEEVVVPFIMGENR